jgi:hypothetical protein
LWNTIIWWFGFGDALPISIDWTQMQWWFGDALPIHMALSLHPTAIFSLDSIFKEHKIEQAVFRGNEL